MCNLKLSTEILKAFTNLFSMENFILHIFFTLKHLHIQNRLSFHLNVLHKVDSGFSTCIKNVINFSLEKKGQKTCIFYYQSHYIIIKSNKRVLVKKNYHSSDAKKPIV
ncbi:hypothetical protein BpHYR1_009235 [Brachionus plicatilis]|uniref:Uncharacterized protein n=1 Tax=Brachionus plicatilis TaxID=10195 RepID=A0A3M7PXU6_BRAPC|nr:hypothetical protein BpHYR1_009235 [Brachionus plicatilis]